MGRSWSSWVNERRLRITVLAVMLALVGCGDRDGATSGGNGPGGSAGPGGALPAPAGAPGTSVTGMPTSPPPRESEPPLPEPATDQALPTDPATPPADPGLDPSTPVASPPLDGEAPAQVAAVDPAPAAAVVREYMTALTSGAFARAQQLWSATPNDSAVLQMARGASFGVEIMPAVRSNDPAATGIVTVPVRVRGTAEDGTERSAEVAYTVRRTAEGTWRISAANVRGGTP